MNYFIIGGDGKQYGPVTGGQMREWVTQGRVNAQTRVRSEAGPDWQPLESWPELADLCGGGNAGAPPPVSGSAPQPMPPPGVQGSVYAVPAATCQLAVWSLGLAILGIICCGLFTGIPAVICGHKARADIRNSQGALGGDGMAVAGLILGYIGIVVTIVITLVYGFAMSRTASFMP